MTILLLDHNMLAQSSTRWPLSIEDLIQLLQSSATSFDTKDEPAEAVDEVEADEDEVVAPVDGIKGDGSDIGVVEVGAV